MTALTRGWLAPRLAFRDFGALHRDIDDLFDSVLGGRPEGPRAWAPRMETFTKDDSVHVRIDVPGVDPKAIDLTLEDDVLTIRGERKAEHEEAAYREVSYGTFERRIRMPDGVDPEAVEAKYSNGVLEVTVPMPKPVNRKVTVAVADGTKPAA